MLIVPPLSPAIRTQRLLALTLADLRRLARRAPPRRREDDWESRIVARFLAMPEQAEPVERAMLVAAMAVGNQIVRLRRVAPRFVPGAAVEAALQALAEGRSGEAIERLKDIDRQLAALPRARPGSRAVLGLQGRHPGDFAANSPDSPPTSTNRSDEVQRDQPVRTLCRPDHGDPRRGLGDLCRRQASGRPLWPDRARLAPGSFRACALCYDRLVDRPRDCALEPLMSRVELKANDVLKASSVAAAPAVRRRSVWSSLRVLPVLVTVAAVCAAAALGWLAWQYYMGAPWTRDGTVRAYVVKIAPQVAGEIVQLPIADNEFVRKGDLLMLIDPRNYSIAVRQAQAAVEQARAAAENANAEMIRREKLNDIAVTMEERQTYISQAATAEATYQSALANLDQARINFKAHASPLPGQRLCHQSYRPAWRLRRCRGSPAFGRQLGLLLGRRLFRGDGARPDPGRRRGDDQAHGI